jgi:hypothetical protein
LKGIFWGLILAIVPGLRALISLNERKEVKGSESKFTILKVQRIDRVCQGKKFMNSLAKKNSALE